MKTCLGLALLTLTSAACAQTTAVKVEIRQMQGRYELLRAGKPYFIKGAGGGQFPERIRAYGGNSIRTWSTSGLDNVLADARKNGLTVMVGLDVARERHGFNYDDPQAVAAQLARIRAEVLKYKNDPAVLFWGIGNELNLEYTNPRVWNAVQQIAQMIHEVDPNHPTSTVLAGCNPQEVAYIKERCPAIDILSINTYAGLAAIPQQVRAAGWAGPYVVAEWGPTGHWESPVTPWKASVEETSSQKAAVYQSRYEASVQKDTTQCLGTYVFLWGQKQERTPTWYGIFTEDGKESEVVDVMQYLWSGKWPSNRAPHLTSFLLNGKKATDEIYLQPRQRYPVTAAVTDPEKDRLTYRYELLPESTDLKSGGDRESRPAPISGLVPAGAKAQTTLTTPTKQGAYRLFVYTYDGRDNVATANIPFYVRGK
ncbi:glycoside hydrolase family 2 TIM barrel-domain containing protein [Hymenobacter endophyticus]|uniref:Glycoside hydrolase family 2 TIM barrel-domain containing protein n=1 Tax=Hymenobacter endophyticus TaxID=3076335 RepID=A0ABU3TIY0_9BACT|nr:glycoside hydrolase family 2 TIM barrel-domain containing protein [Hymenobacter endophyticus]MDU0371316.1 glycoside hydrolase family 2 TIM barrel-domain containing protein [Hymenobacter endophyticus]